MIYRKLPYNAELHKISQLQHNSNVSQTAQHQKYNYINKIPLHVVLDGGDHPMSVHSRFSSPSNLKPSQHEYFAVLPKFRKSTIPFIGGLGLGQVKAKQ